MTRTHRCGVRPPTSWQGRLAEMAKPRAMCPSPSRRTGAVGQMGSFRPKAPTRPGSTVPLIHWDQANGGGLSAQSRATKERSLECVSMRRPPCRSGWRISPDTVPLASTSTALGARRVLSTPSRTTRRSQRLSALRAHPSPTHGLALLSVPPSPRPGAGSLSSRTPMVPARWCSSPGKTCSHMGSKQMLTTRACKTSRASATTTASSPSSTKTALTTFRSGARRSTS
mmetsp:Transcript_38343/g.90459  ORF Transcript_38343/g.90459 Transcript_38343/m.90459 type:complete len:227 (-) Transcript_38343:1190-1870(-)